MICSNVQTVLPLGTTIVTKYHLTITANEANGFIVSRWSYRREKNGKMLV
jgi:hypothetical protein